MGTIKNILIELQDVEVIPQINYIEEQFNSIVEQLSNVEQKMNYLTYSSNAPQLVKSLIDYTDRRASWENEPHRLFYWTQMQNHIVMTYGLYKKHLAEREAEDRLANEEFENS